MLGHAGSRIHNISSGLSKVICDGGRGGGHFNSTFYSVKLCVMINFSLQRNVFCFSFVVVLYSMYSLHAVSKMVLLDEEVAMRNENLRLKSPLRVNRPLEFIEAP